MNNNHKGRNGTNYRKCCTWHNDSTQGAAAAWCRHCPRCGLSGFRGGCPWCQAELRGERLGEQIPDDVWLRLMAAGLEEHQRMMERMTLLERGLEGAPTRNNSTIRTWREEHGHA